MTEFSLRSPNQPPGCIDPVIGLGKPCAPDHALCGDAASCHFLELGQEWAGDREENEANRFDDVIPFYYTGMGIRSLIRHDPLLARDLEMGNFGVVYGDIRGLKSINDKHGEEAGNQLLRIAGHRIIHEAGIRTQQQDIGVDTRRNKFIKSDYFSLGIRAAGSDELMLLVMDVNKEELTGVETRHRDTFSVSRAVTDSEIHSRVPVIISLSSVHASELPSEHTTDAATMIFALRAEAAVRHMERKKEQYRQMAALLQADAAYHNETYTPPADDRLIVSRFMVRCCTTFEQDAEAMLQREAALIAR